MVMAALFVVNQLFSEYRHGDGHSDVNASGDAQWAEQQHITERRIAPDKKTGVGSVQGCQTDLTDKDDVFSADRLFALEDDPEDADTVSEMRWFGSVKFYASMVVTDFRRKESCMAERHFQEQRMDAG